MKKSAQTDFSKEMLVLIPKGLKNLNTVVLKTNPVHSKAVVEVARRRRRARARYRYLMVG